MIMNLLDIGDILIYIPDFVTNRRFGDTKRVRGEPVDSAVSAAFR
jgi:hypothetical protein